MTDTDFLSPVVNQIILTSHIEAVSRASLIVLGIYEIWQHLAGTV